MIFPLVLYTTLTGQDPEPHTAGHKAVENNFPVSGKVPHDGTDCLGAQVVAKCGECLLQLPSVDIARSIAVKSVESIL